jgi:hypothetical protein
VITHRSVNIITAVKKLHCLTCITQSCNQKHSVCKGKVKCTLVQALRLCTGHTGHWGSRGIALPFQDLSTRRGWGVSVTTQLLFTPGKDPVPIVQEADSVCNAHYFQHSPLKEVWKMSGKWQTLQLPFLITAVYPSSSFKVCGDKPQAQEMTWSSHRTLFFKASV